MISAPDREQILTALRKGEITLKGQFLNSSNYTFLGQLSYEELAFQIVYKPTRGEQPLWDFPTGTLARREVAAYLVSDGLGWDLVPPTVYRRGSTPLGPGSLQQYMEHDADYHYFHFNEADKQRLHPVAAFDLLINNADRKGGHILIDHNGHLWLIDHGICFHIEDKLRTVLWDFAGEAIPANLLADIQRFTMEVAQGGEVYSSLRTMLRESEVSAMLQRGRVILANAHFPEPSDTRRSYPWPPV